MAGVEIPDTQAQVIQIDFKDQGIKKTDWALASLTTLARMNKVLNQKMLDAALNERFKGRTLDTVRELVARVIV